MIPSFLRGFDLPTFISLVICFPPAFLCGALLYMGLYLQNGTETFYSFSYGSSAALVMSFSTVSPVFNINHFYVCICRNVFFTGLLWIPVSCL